MLDTQPKQNSTEAMGAYRTRDNKMAGNGKTNGEGPNWSEFTAAINAQRADFKEMLSEIRDEMKTMSANLLVNTAQSKEWVKALKDNSDATDKAIKEDMLEKFTAMDKRVTLLTGVGISILLLSVGSLIAFVVDILKYNLVLK
jgi:hypothetical protein